MSGNRFGRIGKRVSLGSILALLLLGAGVAFAAWTVTGAGSGYAKAGSAQSMTTLNGAGSVGNTLVPGASGDFVVKISNPNAFNVSVDTVTVGSPVSADAGHPTCVTTGVTINQGNVTAALPVTVPGNGSYTLIVSNGASMDNTSDNGCQGATFSVPVTLSGTSA